MGSFAGYLAWVPSVPGERAANTSMGSAGATNVRIRVARDHLQERPAETADPSSGFAVESCASVYCM